MATHGPNLWTLPKHWFPLAWATGGHSFRAKRKGVPDFGTWECRPQSLDWPKGREVFDKVPCGRPLQQLLLCGCHLRLQHLVDRAHDQPTSLAKSRAQRLLRAIYSTAPSALQSLDWCSDIANCSDLEGQLGQLDTTAARLTLRLEITLSALCGSLEALCTTRG
jgi:hypothetical protein